MPESITKMKNKLFKLENDQNTKQISNTLKKNKLCKRENNQGTNQYQLQCGIAGCYKVIIVIMLLTFELIFI